MIKLIIIFTVLFVFVSPRLIFMQQLFRHGARYPIMDSLGDISFAQGKYGQLTEVGKRMQYLLGKELYQQYWTKLGFTDNYGRNLIYVKSTDVNRTIQSVQSQLLGWFQNLNKLKIDQSSLKWSLPDWDNGTFQQSAGYLFEKVPKYHSFPIHSQRSGADAFSPVDILQMFDASNCPNQIIWGQQNQKSDLFKAVQQDEKFKQVRQILGDAFNNGKIIDIFTTFMYIDTYICLQYLDKLKPQHAVITQNLPTLNYIQALFFYLNWFYGKQQIKATSSPFLLQTLANMKKIIKNPQTAQRLVLYSAHDATVANILAGLNLANAQCIYDDFTGKKVERDKCMIHFPIFTSNIIFQLFEQNGRYKIKLRYNGDYKMIPFCNYSYECTFIEFQTFVKQNTYQNYRQVCGLATFAEKLPQKSQISIPFKSKLQAYKNQLLVLLVVLITTIGLYCLNSSKGISKKKKN